MTAFFDDLIAGEDQDAVGVMDGGQTVGDGERRAAGSQLLQVGGHQVFAFVVQRGGCFVQQKYLGCF